MFLPLGTRLVAATFKFRDILVKEKYSMIPVEQERYDHKKGAQEIQECGILC